MQKGENAFISINLCVHMCVYAGSVYTTTTSHNINNDNNI